MLDESNFLLPIKHSKYRTLVKKEKPFKDN